MKSFLQGKKCLEVPALRPPTGPASGLNHASADHRGPLSVATPGTSSAHVEIVKEGGKVTRLVVTCVCGERVEIDCLYSAGT